VRRIRAAGSFLFGLSILAVLMWLAYFALRRFGAFLVALDSTVAAALVAASATIAVSVVSVLTAKHLERKAEIAARLREQKVPVYQDVVDLAKPMRGA
jgi:uncharacterized membrane protein